MRATLQIAVLLLSFFGCKEQSSQPLPADPYERWRSYALHNYSIDQVRICYCRGGGQTMRISVRSDTVALVTRLSDSSKVSAPTSTWYLPIDSLFAIIKHPSGDSLVISYNSRYGYPEKLDINPQLHPRDGGVLFETSNLQTP